MKTTSGTTGGSGGSGECVHDFSLIVGGVRSLGGDVEDALFEAGCDDATLSMQYGRLYVEFSRVSESLESAILSAISAVEGAGIGATVLRVDSVDFVSASEIARRIGRSRQSVHQYIVGDRGPGGFPAPECRLADRAPMWAWCAVSRWLVENGLLGAEEGRNAEVLYAINSVLERRRAHPSRALMELVERRLGLRSA